MKSPKLLAAALGAAASVALLLGSPVVTHSRAAASGNEPDPRDVSAAVSKLLEQLHYTKHPLDDQISDRLLHNYLETLDYAHLYYTQKDVALFEKKYATALDDDVLVGDLAPAYIMYDVFQKRVEERVAKIKAMLKDEKFDFQGHGSITLNRQKAPWPKDDAEADALWHDRIENELLGESLNEHPVETPVAVVTKRYDRLLRSLHEQTKEDQVKYFLNALATAYDPHSEYFTPTEFENFSINMRLSLVGIGAQLQSEDGYAKIKELIVGGPADQEGSLKPNDRITAVAQGTSGQFVDVIDLKLDKVVELIRGKKGTVVRLQVIPASSTDPSKRKIVSITRDEVKLTEQEAKAEIIEQKTETGETAKLGWITLPSFYADMNSRSSSAKSTTRDVRALLDRLNKEGVNGLVIDLRKNGGGSLEEAISLTGLFIKRGPVVQAKDSDKRVTVSSDRDPSVSYSGPMVVLTSHLSASASEIFAGALQDYGRAVIVGDKNTFGKGTVQTMVEVGRALSPFGFRLADAGALKLTIQKFYRPSGQSTQLKGVESDVVLPSRYAHLDIGEDSLKFPLPYDEVKPADYEKWTGARAQDLNDLRARSAARVKTSPEFRYALEDIAQLDKRIHDNQISLNIDERKSEIAADKARVEARKAERK
ncbi:MAG: carboxy terminal-processing peptidase, partial [Verrucomicrobia bacterium]|nr:carboxy terminal-processing peptidase [Verrucomicrobiota bacterium]